MIIYSDTSALAKRYLEEPGSHVVREYLDDAEYRYTSAFTELELIAAIEFSKRLRRINSPEYRTITVRLTADFHQGLLSLIDINDKILQRAISMIRVRGLKAPDAIQLATALALNKRLAHSLHFLCADQPLLTAARKEGLRCRDVSS